MIYKIFLKEPKQGYHLHLSNGSAVGCITEYKWGAIKTIKTTKKKKKQDFKFILALLKRIKSNINKRVICFSIYVYITMTLYRLHILCL